MIRRTGIAALVLALTASACQKENAAAPADATAAEAATKTGARRDWTLLVSPTPEGGFVMGNPNAPVKLVEYGSLTCSHCADFAAKGAPALRDGYVRDGKVSFEFRNFVRDPIDFTGALLTRCSGAGPFFKLTEQLFADQANMFERFQGLSEAEQRSISALPQNQQFAALAKAGGLDQFVKVRGVAPAKANQCLSDSAAIAKLLEVRQTAVDRYQIQGTPSFLINGELVPNTAAWEELEPKIKAAIG